MAAADAPEAAARLRIGDHVDAGLNSTARSAAEYVVLCPEPGVPDFWLPMTLYSCLFKLDCSGDRLASRPAAKPCGLPAGCCR